MPIQTTLRRMRSSMPLIALLAFAGCGESTQPRTNPIPTIQSVSGTEGDSLVLTVSGTGYVATSFVSVNGAPLISRFVSRTRIEARLPIDGARFFQGIVSVTNPAPGGGVSQDVPFSWSAGPSPQPTLTALSPTFVAAGVDSVVVQLTGTGFVRQTMMLDPVAFTSRPIRLISPTSAQVTLPAAVLARAGFVNISVWNQAPGGGTSGVLPLEVRAPTPVITALRQTSVPVGRSQFLLQVDGTGFLDSSVVQINGSRRVTRRTAAGTLEATLTEADLAEVAALQVSVINAAPGGGTSNASVFNVAGVVPTLSLLPTTGGTVGGGFTLAAHGAGFARNSIIRWNNADLVTLYRSGTRLTANVPDALMSATGTASITVFTAGPGGGTSSPIAFTTRTLNSSSGTSQFVGVRAADVAYSEQTGKLYATAIASDSQYPNRLVEIDAVAGTVSRSVAIGTDPRLLAMADDGRLLYVGVDGQNAVRRIDVTTFVPGIELPMLRDGFGGPTYAADIAVVPGRPRSVVVTQYFRGLSPPLAATTVFDDAVPRSKSGPGHTGASRIEFAGADSLLYGFNDLSTGFDLFMMRVDASGLSIVRNVGSVIAGFSTEIVGASGRIYGTDGTVVDAERQVQMGRFTGGGAMFVDPALGRAFRLASGKVDVIDINTFSTIGSVTIPGASSPFDPFNVRTIYRVVRCGTQCLAWADGTRVVIARSAMFGQ